MTGWSDLLDAFEARLDRCRRLVEETDASELELGPWPPPEAPTEPMPADCVERARRALDEAGRLQAALEAKRGELPALRSTVRNRRAPGFSSLSTHL